MLRNRRPCRSSLRTLRPPSRATSTSLPADGIAATPTAPDDFSRFWHWLIGGNILAKVGVVLLFFGVASGLRLAVQYGFMPVSVRLALGAIAAIAMVWFGHNRVAKGVHQIFGHALQGGGFAILYLIVYFMLARYQMMGAAPAFLAFAAIGAVCVLMAARQNAQSLAGLGISGAFLAPILASTGSGEYIVLFGYYLLLNAFVVTVNWFKGWRYLNLAAFVFTFLVGFAWGSRSYRPEYFATIEAFLIVFFLIFSALPVLMIVCNAPGKRSVADGLLLFGTPIAVAGFQQAILVDRMALAWSATIAGVYYLALWRLLFVRHDSSIEVVERSQLGIGAVFLTMAVPLAFGAQVTTVLWALEGSVLLWYGLRLKRSLACAAGMLLQFAAGLYFIFHIGDVDHARPFFNSVVIGAIVIALAALFSARTAGTGRQGTGLEQCCRMDAARMVSCVDRVCGVARYRRLRWHAEPACRCARCRRDPGFAVRHGRQRDRQPPAANARLAADTGHSADHASSSGR